MNEHDLEGTLGAAMRESVAGVSMSAPQRVRAVHRARARRRRKALGAALSIVTVIAVASASLISANRKDASHEIDVINPSPAKLAVTPCTGGNSDSAPSGPTVYTATVPPALVGKVVPYGFRDLVVLAPKHWTCTADAQTQTGVSFSLAPVQPRRPIDRYYASTIEVESVIANGGVGTDIGCRYFAPARLTALSRAGSPGCPRSDPVAADRVDSTTVVAHAPNGQGLTGLVLAHYRRAARPELSRLMTFACALTTQDADAECRELANEFRTRFDHLAPLRSAWKPIPAAPIAPRSDMESVWTGQELVIWGGRSFATNPAGADVSDGAWYAPSTRQWHRMRAAPFAWTQDAYVARLAFASGGGAVFAVGAKIARYEPSSDTWQRLPDIPSDFLGQGSAENRAGTMLVSWGQHAAGMLRLDGPAIGGWQTVPLDLTKNEFPMASFLTDDGRLFLWRNTQDRARRAVVVDLATGRSRSFAPSPGIFEPVAWTGKELIATSIYDGLYAFNPKTLTYREIGRHVVTNCGATAVVGDALLKVAGSSCQGDDRFSTTHTIDLGSGAVHVLDDLPGGRNAMASAWTGHSMIVWGGGGEYNGTGAVGTPSIVEFAYGDGYEFTP